MTDSIKGSGPLQLLIAPAMFVVVVAGMRAAQPVLVPVLLAAFIAIICWPAMNWLQEKGLPGWLAMGVVVAAFAIVGMLCIGLISSSLNDFVGKLPDYEERLGIQKRQLLEWMEEKGIDLSDQAEQSSFDTHRLVRMFGQLLTSLAGMLSNALLIFLILVFILFEAAGMPAKIRAMSGNAHGGEERYKQIVSDIRRYISIKTSTSLLTGILIALLLQVLGVDYPILWGLLAFLFNYVPNIGSFIAAIPAVMLALIQLGPWYMLYSATGYIVVNVLIGNLIEPRVMGRGLGLSTLVVFLSLLFWGWVLGPVGMLLSVPLTMIAKIVLEGSSETRWIAILLSSEAAVQSINTEALTTKERVAGN